MTPRAVSILALHILGLLAACNRDVPISATTDLSPPGYRVTVTRVATHPFLARFNLKLAVNTTTGCSVVSDLFPDTGGVSRRNLYLGDRGVLFVVGQFDVRRFDASACRVELIEFRFLHPGMLFLGSFDVDGTGQWTFLSPAVRAERPFEKQ